MADIKNKLKNVREKNYLLKEFTDYRSELLGYARAYFPNKINDFSESSLGGMLLDFAAITGDALSYYMDHQFGELDPSLASERDNILRHIRRAGIKAVPPSPASVDVSFFIEVDAFEDNNNSEGISLESTQLLTIKTNTIVNSSTTSFTLMEDVDFSDNLYDNFIVSERDNDNKPTKVIISKKGLCVSGNITTETFTFGTEFIKFPTVELSNSGVTQVLSVLDTDNNEFFEVEFLTQDTIFLKGERSNASEIFNLKVKPALRRFIKEDDSESGVTVLRFGSDNGQDLEDEILKDPSDAALPLYGKTYINKFSIDPASLLRTNTLGIAPRNTTISVRYMHGGGVSHNVSAGDINEVLTINVSSPDGATASIVDQVLETLDVRNLENAVGGTEGFNIDELQELIPTHMKMQNRVVNYHDIMARIYTLPAPFGRIHRAAIRNNEDAILSKYLHIICKDTDGTLIQANDAIKNNLSKYLNEFRLIGDIFEIVDTKIINIAINLDIKVGVGENTDIVIARVINRLISNLRLESYNIDQPIVLSDIVNIVINTQGVTSLSTLPENLVSIALADDDFTRVYSNNVINLKNNIKDGVLYPPEGSIFELKYPSFDISVNT